MVEHVTNAFLETLRNVLVEEVKRLLGTSDEVKKVEGDLKTIHELLMDADGNRRDSRGLRNCVVELKELAVKAENILEKYSLEVESKKQGESLMENLGRLVCILCEGFSIHQVRTEIDDVRSRLANLTIKLQSIHTLGGKPSSKADELPHLLRLQYAHKIERHFVGMEDEFQCLMWMVKDESVSVISICGMGGLGKTTMARKIYNHPDCQQHFDGRAWVCLTQQFQPGAVLRDISRQIGKQTYASMGVPELVAGIRGVLEQGEFLVVIDDIWENDHWMILGEAFPENCKVVLTTRSESVACEEHRRLHKLGFLSEDEGWELLAKTALPDATTTEFEDIGRHLVRRCGGLPLAILVIGGLLRQKPNLGEWEKVSSNLDLYLKRGLGTGNYRRVKQVLDLSYDALPYYLKSCFLSLAYFAEDQRIDTEKLYLLWMSENLISSEDKEDCECLRDVAERYLAELASRCMVLVEKDEWDFTRNRFTSCMLHDLMHDLCSSKAKQEKFLTRIDVSKHQHPSHSSIDASIHRLVINMDIDDGDDEEVATLLSSSRVQEFRDLISLSVRCKSTPSNRKINVPFQNLVNFENSKHLRILLLYSLAFEDRKLPSAIEKLRFLRYLSLWRCEVEEVSRFVCELPFLKFLDLSLYGTIKLPNLFWKMRRLRYLRLPNKIEVIGGEKLRVDGMSELETLIGINSGTACIAGIITLTKLLNLDATIERDMDGLSEIADYMSSSLCSLRQTELHLCECDFGSGEEGRNIVKNVLMSPSLTSLYIQECKMQRGFPCYEQGMCGNLTFLSFEHSQIGGDGDVVQELGKYPKLQYLLFQDVEEQEARAEVKFGADSFPKLEVLDVHDHHMKKWEVEEGAIPKLYCLWLECSNLEKLPDRLRFPTLRSLQCYKMSDEFMLRTMEGGEDHANISHISDLIIK